MTANFHSAIYSVPDPLCYVNIRLVLQGTAVLLQKWTV